MEKIIKKINDIVPVKMKKTDSHKCRFMGFVDTYDITLPDKNFTYPKSILHKPYGGACILPFDSDGNVYLEIQYRFPIRETLLELPAGRCDDGETFLDCATRELREETGCISDEIRKQSITYGQPEFSDEKIGIFLAINAKQTEEQDLDTDESVKIEKIPFESACELVRRNVIIDERTIIAIGFAKCLNNITFMSKDVNFDEYEKKMREKIKEEGEELVEEDIDTDYTKPCEFGLVQDHIVKVPGNKNSRRECLYVKSEGIVIPISEQGKIGFTVRFMPAVEKNLVELPSEKEFEKENLTDFGEMVTVVGYSNDRVRMYLKKDLPENDEFIWCSKDEIFNMINENIIVDGRVLGAVFKYFI